VAASVKELQDKIRRLRLNLEKTRKKAAELKKAEETLTLDLAAAERLLASERPRRGRRHKDKTPPPSPPVVGPSHPRSVSSNGSNKTEVAVGVIASADGQGATADDIYAVFQERGIKAKRNYVFNITSRLKQAEKIEQRGGRFYLKKA
jgi:hypothetical protein